MSTESIDTYIESFEKAESTFSGENLQDHLLKIVNRASENLSRHDIGSLYDFLHGKGYGFFLDQAIGKSYLRVLQGNPLPETLNIILPSVDISVQPKLAYKTGKLLTRSEILEVVDIFQSDYAKEQLLLSYGQQNLSSDPVGTISDFLEVRKGEMSLNMLPHLVSALQVDPDDFRVIAEMISENQISKEQFPEIAEARTNLLANWARQDPSSVAEYVIQPGNKIPASEMKTVIGNWMRSEPTNAVRWVEGLKSGPSKDFFRVGVSESQLKVNPEKAWHSALKIDDLGMKTRAAQKAFEHWKLHDPISAQEKYDDFKILTSSSE